MTLADLGEFGAIGLLRELLASARPSLQPAIGIGDDAAVWAPAPGHLALQTTDLLIEEVHFSLRYFDWYDVGWKSMAVNVSDVAAMGGRPRAAFVSAGLKPAMLTSDVQALYRGLLECAAEYDVAILGGDTVASPMAAVLNVALYGESLDTSGIVLRRDRARLGDGIAVTGPLGSSAAALRLLAALPAARSPRPAPLGDRPKDLQASGSDDAIPASRRTRQVRSNDLQASRLDGAVPTSLLAAHLHPQPRVAMGQRLLAAGVRCGMDVSDGLLADLGKICQASGLGARIQMERVPVATEVTRMLPDEALELALSGGEDYELLVCGARDVLERLDLIVLGEMVEQAGVRIVTEDGQERVIERAGYDAFV